MLIPFFEAATSIHIILESSISIKNFFAIHETVNTSAPQAASGSFSHDYASMQKTSVYLIGLTKVSWPWSQILTWKAEIFSFPKVLSCRNKTQYMLLAWPEFQFLQIAFGQYCGHCLNGHCCILPEVAIVIYVPHWRASTYSVTPATLSRYISTSGSRIAFQIPVGKRTQVG